MSSSTDSKYLPRRNHAIQEPAVGVITAPKVIPHNSNSINGPSTSYYLPNKNISEVNIIRKNG